MQSQYFVKFWMVTGEIHVVCFKIAQTGLESNKLCNPIREVIHWNLSDTWQPSHVHNHEIPKRKKIVKNVKFFGKVDVDDKILLQFYSVLHNFTTPVLILCYYSVLHKTTQVQLYHSSTILYYKVLLRYYSLYYKARICHQGHHMICLPRKVTLIINRRDIRNVSYNVQSNRIHPPTSPNNAPATQKDSRHMCNVIYTARSNRCHPPTSPSTVPATKSHLHTTRGATGITLQPHQMLCLPRKKTHILDFVTYQTSCTMRGATGITLQPHAIPMRTMKLQNCTYFSPFGNAFCNENYNISRPGYLPRFRKMQHLPLNMTLQDHQTLRLPRKVPLIRHIWNVIYNARTVGLTKCYATWHAWLILVTYKMSSTIRETTGITLQSHLIVRLPRKIALRNLRKIYRK